MVQACHPLNARALTIFFPFATTPAALYYFSIHSIHWLFSPQHGRWPFSLYFINSSLHLTVPTDYPPFPFSSHSPHSPTLYLLPGTEHYPLEPTNILYSPISDCSCFFQIGTYSTPLPPLPYPALYPTANPTHHLAIIFSTTPSLLPAILPIQAVSRTQWVRRSCEDWCLLISPCFPEAQTEIKCIHNHWFLFTQTQKIGI